MAAVVGSHERIGIEIGKRADAARGVGVHGGRGKGVGHGCSFIIDARLGSPFDGREPTTLSKAEVASGQIDRGRLSWPRLSMSDPKRG
ncbi:hypothetical protein GCM10009776_01410 [Microbacterium deminutum]|uniref:Uncharacterized protein n=1 Tax=Microbacterium deminutum TaxID=344164 RepID=A0ABN2Q458_9MICO